MSPDEIKAVLQPLGILNGVNMYPDEPTPSFHCISVVRGMGDMALDALNAIGGEGIAMRVPGCGSPYGEALFVRRTPRKPR